MGETPNEHACMHPFGFNKKCFGEDVSRHKVSVTVLHFTTVTTHDFMHKHEVNFMGPGEMPNSRALPRGHDLNGG
jgi:hypothetical protein